MGWGLNSSNENSLSVGSKSSPGTVAQANSCGENSTMASCCFRSSFSLSNLARLLSLYKKLFSPYNKKNNTISINHNTDINNFLATKKLKWIFYYLLLPWAKYLSICNIYWFDLGKLRLLGSHDPSSSNLSDVMMTSYHAYP